MLPPLWKGRIVLLFAATLGAVSVLIARRPLPPKPLEEYVVRHIGFWSGERPALTDGKFRFSKPSQDLIEYLVRVNSDEGITSIPSAENITNEDISRVKAMVAALPESVQSLFSPEILNITVVSGLGSSAFSSSVFGNDGMVVGGFIVIDRSVLNRSPNDWFTWRENSPFNCDAPDSDKIRATISSTDTDDGLRYIFLHEAAHVYAYSRSFHPQWNEAPSPRRIEETTYAPFSWTALNGSYQPIFNNTRLLHKGIRYYARPENRLPCSAASEAYKELATTNFPALYASTDPIEDFGESFANFIHVVILGRPFSVTRVHGEINTELLNPCWSRERCNDKYQFFSKFFPLVK
jgi:hypothetical protein